MSAPRVSASRIACSSERPKSRTMDRAGFEPYDNEWWHFTLRDERYPDRYFDFPVEVTSKA